MQAFNIKHIFKLHGVPAGSGSDATSAWWMCSSEGGMLMCICIVRISLDMFLIQGVVACVGCDLCV